MQIFQKLSVSEQFLAAADIADGQDISVKLQLCRAQAAAANHILIQKGCKQPLKVGKIRRDARILQRKIDSFDMVNAPYGIAVLQKLYPIQKNRRNLIFRNLSDNLSLAEQNGAAVTAGDADVGVLCLAGAVYHAPHHGHL